MPARLTPASRVVTGPRLRGTAPRARMPRAARAFRRGPEVCVPPSPTNTSRPGSMPLIRVRHSARAVSSRSVALRLLSSPAAPRAVGARPGSAPPPARAAGRRSPATSTPATPARRRRRRTPPRARPAWHRPRRRVDRAARHATAAAPSAAARAAARSPPGCRSPAAGPGTAPRSAATPRTASPPAAGSSPHRPRPPPAHADPSSTPAPSARYARQPPTVNQPAHRCEARLPQLVGRRGGRTGSFHGGGSPLSGAQVGGARPRLDVVTRRPLVGGVLGALDVVGDERCLGEDVLPRLVAVGARNLGHGDLLSVAW